MTEQLAPFEAEGKQFTPQAYLIRVDEPDFGCEGVPEGEEITGTVRMEDADGERTVPIAAKDLFATRLYDKMWIGEREGETVLVTRKREVLQINRTELEWWNTVRRN